MAIQTIRTLLLGSVLLLAACGSTNAEPTEQAGPDTTAPPTESVAAQEAVSDAPEGLAITDDSTASGVTDDDETDADAPDEIADESDTSGPDETDEQIVLEPVCEAPEKEGYFVDVAIDDPDGGLNMRSGPGVENTVLATIPRGKELISTGLCSPVGSADWWEVTATDGSITGWVSSRYLTQGPVFNPGLGAPIEDPDMDGLTGESSDDIALALADRYGFDEDATITYIDGYGHDAQGATAIYEITGAKDDSIDGIRFEIDFFIDRDESDEGAQIGVRAYRVTTRALCTRGVTDDGLCI